MVRPHSCVVLILRLAQILYIPESTAPFGNLQKESGYEVRMVEVPTQFVTLTMVIQPILLEHCSNEVQQANPVVQTPEQGIGGNQEAKLQPQIR